MTDNNQHTSFWDHLEDLRGVLIRIVIVLLVFGVGSFVAMPWIFDNIIMAPVSPDFPTYKAIESISEEMGFAKDFNVDIVSLQLTSQFFLHMSSSCWSALVLGFPFIIYYLWSFVAPGLYDHEKRGVKRVFFFGNVMFFAGVALGYFVVFPIALRFLAGYRLSDAIRPIVSLESYMENFFMIILLMGLVFELPILCWFLGKAGLLTRSFFSRYRRHAIVALLVLAAIITPTGDPFTLFAVFLPVYGLWELGALLVPKDKPESDT